MNDFPDGPFDIIYADPPWSYDNRMKCNAQGDRWTSGAENHYPTMGTAEIGELPVQGIAADDCLLFMWVTNPLLEDGLRVGKEWGFKYVTVGFVWVKNRPLAGNYTMGQTELCAIFKRGRIPQPRGARNVRQLIEAPLGRHSEKPSEARERIEEMFPEQRKIELFARMAVPGWDSWGNEI